MIRINGKIFLFLVVLSLAIDALSTYLLATKAIDIGLAFSELIQAERSLVIKNLWKFTESITVGVVGYFAFWSSVASLIFWKWHEDKEGHWLLFVLGVSIIAGAALAASGNFLVFLGYNPVVPAIQPPLILIVLLFLFAGFKKFSEEKNLVEINF